jgi:NAD(P)-dependent dehydrogenase (short-subunit alcohol dehydrogenase family)
MSSKFAESKIFELVQVENPDIRVHNVHPGGIKTQMVDKTEAAGPMAVPLDDRELSVFYLSPR